MYNLIDKYRLLTLTLTSSPYLAELGGLVTSRRLPLSPLGLSFFSLQVFHIFFRLMSTLRPFHEEVSNPVATSSPSPTVLLFP